MTLQQKQKVLIISYYWPPSGGAGVQRWLKFVKYLRDFGWEPVIYTPENPEYPVSDFSLEKDIPKNLEILRTKVWEPYDLYKKFVGLKKADKINTAFLSEKKKTNLTERIAVWIRGNFFVPDARKFWIKPSVKFLTAYLSKNPVDAIISTGPPHSMHLIAFDLHKKTGIPWVADFRDPWTGIDFYHELHLTPWADNLHKKLEIKVLKNADRVIVISDGMKKHFEELLKRDYDVITNGFDEEDYPNRPIEPDEKFSVAHVGSLVKSRNPEVLWEALKDLTQNLPQFAENLEIKLVGKVDFFVTESIRKHGLEKYLRIIPYLDHNKVVDEQHKSHLLLLLINNTPNAEMILTGKLFEYLSSRRPILCIGPENGDAANIIRETGSGKIAGFRDVKKIKEIISTQFIQEKGLGNIHLQNIDHYSRKQLTAKLSEILKNLTATIHK